MFRLTVRVCDFLYKYNKQDQQRTLSVSVYLGLSQKVQTKKTSRKHQGKQRLNALKKTLIFERIAISKGKHLPGASPNSRL